ncbi:MAG: hypothetical protein ABI301_05160 [Jatrophihabitantaceae bacterium]
MSEFEDLIRRSMQTHDDQAPTVAQFRQRDARWTPRRNVRWLAGAAAAACVLAVVGVLLAVDHRAERRKAADPTPSTTAPGPSAVLSCPKTYAPTHSTQTDGYWVPEPAKGANGKSRLVPQELPGHVVVCAYLGTGSALTAHRQLTGDLSIVPATFSWLLPRADVPALACATNISVGDGNNYLFGIGYPGGGVVWVSAPGQHCEGASNGQFLAADNLANYANDALNTGSWQLDPLKTVDGCPAMTTFGRLGQESALVPDDPISVQVCATSGAGVPVVGKTSTGSGFRSLVNALKSVTARKWDVQGYCRVTTGPPTVRYIATFRYAVGPPLQVTVEPACGDAVYNGSLQASRGGAAILQQVQALLSH